MRRHPLLLILGLGLAGAVFLVLRLRPPASTTAEQPAPPPAVERPKPPLQADAAGSYVPGYPFKVNRLRFAGFNLRPEAYVTFTEPAGTEQSVACLETLIRADTVHLRCEDPQMGTVTIDGKFLTRLATTRLDAAVVSAVVTFRAGSGDVLYRARDSFQWHPRE
jgi:hypothetical protein